MSSASMNDGVLVLSLTWPASSPAPSVWTVVEWQAASGAWYTVEGWQGGLDQVLAGQGQKTWWVYHADLGKGPFRWRVYRANGALLATSEPFNLPRRAGDTELVSLQITP